MKRTERDRNYEPERIARDEANKNFQVAERREGRILLSSGGQDFLDRMRKINRDMKRVQK